MVPPIGAVSSKELYSSRKRFAFWVGDVIRSDSIINFLNKVFGYTHGCEEPSPEFIHGVLELPPNVGEGQFGDR